MNGHDIGIIPQLQSIESFPVISKGLLSLHTDEIEIDMNRPDLSFKVATKLYIILWISYSRDALLTLFKS